MNDARLIPDGNLIRRRDVENVRWVGFKIHAHWEFTDPSGHRHDAATFHASTYQPTEEIYCVDHGEVETRSIGERLCRQCQHEVKPEGMWGDWNDARPLPYVWSVEYVGPGERHRWEQVPDELGMEIFNARQIAPFLDRLRAEVGEPVNSEWCSG